MALFEQYEQAANVSSAYKTGRFIMPEMTTAGIINAKLEDEDPMFVKKRCNLTLTECVSHMAVCNNRLVLGMKNKVRRLDPRYPDKFDEIPLQKNAGERIKIYDLYLDPTGKHLLVSLVHLDNGGPVENIQFLSSSKKAQYCSKMKGHIISSVAWNRVNPNENSTGSILIGTTNGFIFETELASGEDRPFFLSGPEQYWKQMLNINENVINSVTSAAAKTITGLVFHRISADTYFVLATTPSRLFQFIGNVNLGEPPMLQHIFSNYSPDIPESFIELPGQLPYSKLQMYYQPSNSQPLSFAWMTEPGVMYGNINYNARLPENLIGSSKKLILYPADKEETGRPLSIVHTEFHILVLFHDRLKVMSVLNEQLVFEDIFTETYGQLKGIVKDPTNGTVWAFSDMAIYRYTISKEERYVWEAYLEKKNYRLAKEYCQGDAAKIDKVLSKQAEDLFQNKQYAESAVIYAETYNSFEEIGLKFLEAEQEAALQKFLLKKLNGLKSQDKTQITMIVMWLLEIYLNNLGMMRTAGKTNTQEYKNIEAELQDFLSIPKVNMCVSDNRSAVYNLLSNHGDEESLIYFTNKMKDFEKVIKYHLRHKNYKAVLDVLNRQSQRELFYQFSPALMKTKPRETVDAWIVQDRRLNAVLLIPALVQYEREPERANEAIRYLEHCVLNMGVRDQEIHNFLITMYAREHNLHKLMLYLNLQEETDIPYDQKYALRVCSERKGLEEACVHIYSTMGLYEEAVDLALQVDVELGKHMADRPEEDDALRKMLWLKIAKHVVKEKNDIKRAMEFLRECHLIQIEDILPFFPDFVTIDHFKDAICSSLQEYNQHIEGLKEEMDLATESAQEIRSEVQSFRNNFAMVTGQDKCAACSYPILSSSFYHFPCHHALHAACLIAEVLPHLPPTQQSRVADLQRQNEDKLSAELDDLVASECLYCGDIMIRSIDSPFVNMADYGSVMQSWE